MRELRRARAAARLSRPLRRRPVRHAGRDGLRRPLRPRRRAAGPRPGARRVAELFSRGARRGAAGGEQPRSPRCRPCSPRRGLGAMVHELGTVEAVDRIVIADAAGDRRARRDAHRAARRLVRDQLPDAGAARQPGLRAGRVRAAARPEGSGPVRRADLRSGRGRRRAVHRARRAARDRDPARAGRQQPGRDGGRLRPRRLPARSTCT